MLALTYPDGARVQRCDYLPENTSLAGSSLPFKSSPSNLGFQRLSINELAGTNSGPKALYALRFRRRLRRGEKLTRQNTTDSSSIPSQTGNGPFYIFEKNRNEHSHRDGRSCSAKLYLDSQNVEDNSCDPCRPDKSSHFQDKIRNYSQDSYEYRASSQSPNIHNERGQKLAVFDVDDSYSNSYNTRRRELPGRESWPGGRHPKDRCFLQLVLILVLLMIGSNRHSGPLGSRVNRTAFGVFAFGSVAVNRVDCAPVDILTDTGVRSERSANLSHITGASRKIQMYIKNRHLQILPDGTVNGSNDDTSDFTVLQRTSVSRGQLRIQGVATCLYLCMDSCGLLYGSREYTEDCVFNETLEQHNYNTYSSVHWSTRRKTLYLGLSGRGQPRRVQANGHNLGRLSAYARVLTQVVPQDRVEGLHRRMLGAKHNVRHHHGSQQTLCPAPTPQEKDGRDKFRCRKRKKRKKRRRKCKPGEIPSQQCDPREITEAQSKRSCEGAAGDEACRKEALDTPAKKRKSRIEEEDNDKPELDEVEEDLAAEKKSRRSNNSQRKKARKYPLEGNKKSGGTKKRKIGAVNAAKGNKSGGKIGKKKTKETHGSGRFARTTSRLGSSLSMTSPISNAADPSATSPTPIENSSIFDKPTPENGALSSGGLNDRPNSLSSSSSSVSAVSLAATSLASTLTLTVAAGAEVFSQDRTALEINTDNNPSTIIADFDELVDVKDEDEDEEENDDDDEERDEPRQDFGRIASPKTSLDEDQRLAM